MHIALLEDDGDQAAGLRVWLDDAGHRIVHFADARAFLRSLRRDSYDLCIFDWLLPDITGTHVLRRIREHDELGVPVMFVT